MAGTINLSLSQQFDSLGKPLGGGQLYFFQAASVGTPQNAFQDSALTIPWPNPMTLDAAGRIPQFYLADGLIKVRLQDKNGVVQIAADNLMVIGASSGGGGGGSVDATTIAAVGDLKCRYDNAQINGWVRANGGTIGNFASAASELNSDTLALALYTYLWGKDPNLVVIGGRGVSAAADFNGSKKLTLPDWRGYALSGLDGMGNALAGRLTIPYAGLGNGAFNADLLGAVAGLESETLSAAQSGIPAHDHPVFLRDTGHYHNVAPTPFTSFGAPNLQGFISGTGSTASSGGTDTNTKNSNITIGSISGTANDNKTAQVTAAAASQAHRSIGPRKLCTIYIKL